MLDEPFAALDAFTKEDLGRPPGPVDERQVHGVLVTHDLREAAYLGDTVYVMSDGQDVSSCPRAAAEAAPAGDDVRCRLYRSCRRAPRHDRGREVQMSAALDPPAKAIKYSRPWMVALALILIWEGACRVFHIPEFVLPDLPA